MAQLTLWINVSSLMSKGLVSLGDLFRDIEHLFLKTKLDMVKLNRLRAEILFEEELGL